MAELVARGLNSQQEWRRELPAKPVTLGRLATACDWDVPWDRRISSLHATLVWTESGLRVCRSARGKNPIFFGGVDQGFQEFSVSPGETFIIGETIFSVLAETSGIAQSGHSSTVRVNAVDMPEPQAEWSISREEVRRLSYVDADQRIEVLATLPEVIRKSANEEELKNRIVEVLLRGIPRGTASAVVRLTEETGRQKVSIGATAIRGGGNEEIRVSRRLVATAIGSGQSVLHRWVGADRVGEFTADAAADWAICTPVLDDHEPGWGLYVMGRLHESPRKRGQPEKKWLESDLKFVEAVAQIFGALRHVRDMLTSLGIAQEIQAGFFPRTMPEVPGYELAAGNRPADATGGDYCDIIPLPSGRVGLTIADVSGHGLGPSLLMASVRALLRGFARRESTPETLLGDLNAALFPDLRPQYRFITLLYGMLDPVGHLFHFANAGHGPLTLHLPAGQTTFACLADDNARGCPLGIFEEPYRPCTPLALAPGDLLILGSDGLVEARRGGTLFGMERAQQFLLENRDRPVQEILDGLMAAVTSFHGHGRPDDDLTLLLVRRK